MLNTNNRTIKDVPVYGYDLKNGLTSVNNMISVINGNKEFVTEITDAIKELAIDDIFNIYGRTFKVDNIYKKDGLFLIAEVYANVNPDPEPEPEPEPEPTLTPSKITATLTGGNTLRYGRSKSWTVTFTDTAGATVEKTDFTWNVISSFTVTKTIVGNKISLKCSDDKAIDESFTLQVLESDGTTLVEQVITITG